MIAIILTENYSVNMLKIQRNKFSFKNQSGHQLAAILEQTEASPPNWLLYAHCFTCSKDIITASRISRALVQQQFAVMRFDFTGLGESEGQFSESNFTSNVQDLIAASAYLEKHYQAPNVIMGHSFGGAAVLAALKDLPQCKAAITLAAPSEPANIFSHFESAREIITQQGEMQQRIGDQELLLTKQLLDDVDQYHLVEHIRELDIPLLILHAQNDATVGIEHAHRIYDAAPNPKQFIALPDADHLLTNRKDAVFVADIVAAWTKRYATTTA